MSASRPDDSIVLEASANDVLLGRGNAVNFREGNVRFRKLAQSKALRYATCSNKLEKDRIAESIISEIRSIGGSFLRPISARNDKGEHLSAWEQVPKDVALTKAKQTLRDCAAAIRRETAMRSSTPSPPSLGTSQHQSTFGVLPQRQNLDLAASSPPQNSLPYIHSLPSTLGTDSSTLRSTLPISLITGSTSHQPYGALSSQLLDDQQSRLLEIFRHRQQSGASGDSSGTVIHGVNSSGTSMHAVSGSAIPLVSGTINADGGNQQDLPISPFASDLRRARELMLIEQYYREQLAAEAQQRIIWNQISSQARARHDAAYLQPRAADLLLQLGESHRLVNVQGLEARTSGSDFDGRRPHQEAPVQSARDRGGEAKVRERTSSFDTPPQEKSQGSSDHSSNSTNRPLKKRKGLPKQG